MKKNVCIYFEGLGVDVCAAGISLSQAFDDRTPGVGLRIPCIQDGKDSRLTCEKLRLPTAEELAKSEEDLEALLARYEKASELSRRIKAEHRGESWNGIEACPVCGGKLHLSISGYNGHVWGRCETKDCLNWME